ncbi:phosphatidylglycerophosphatase A [Paraburkholderia sp.]|jgi:phosphatidylglycerophosphatase A|uniref:phosphatidylglycerophosphatase A family protein n=1 Tax=Paraburkholderia sp. TaxID=1926495 RepID=UPI002F3EDD2C
MQTEPSLGPADKTPGDVPPDGQPPRAPDPGAVRPRQVSARFMLSHPLHLFSLGFGSGLSPVAPGTFGTLFAWASFAVLNRYLTVLDWGLLIVVGFFAGIWITGFTAKKLGIEDPSSIVWDEVVAFWLVLLMVTPVTLTGQVWAFVVFRFFDTVKPPPIRYFDRRLKGGFGIMFDDLVAAFFTLLVIALWRMSV